MVELNTIVDQVLRGDKSQFRHIIKACNLPLYRVAIVMMKNEADAEDAIQSSYLKAFLHLPSFRKESSFLTWITRILINECKMALRGKKKMTGLEDGEAKQKETPDENANELMFKNQMYGLLQQAILSLPEKYRLVYTFREVNEMPIDETALALGLTKENVKVRLHRAKSLVKENILNKIPAQELFPFGNSRCDSVTERVMRSIAMIPVFAMES
ncbi:RNA polymerase sigma factor [Cytophagales bacterium WSM2-2]|nr:RNA polymerase sigma factor [Cytophagales bacterium WSM2-2]